MKYYSFFAALITVFIFADKLAKMATVAQNSGISYIKINDFKGVVVRVCHTISIDC